MYTDNAQMTIAGTCQNKDRVLYWFVLRDESWVYEYIPIEFEIVNKDEYKFVKRHRGLDRGRDIFTLMWGYGYTFFVNNPDCGSMTITNEQGKVETIDIEEIPFVYYYKGIPSKYQFWSIDGERELR